MRFYTVIAVKTQYHNIIQNGAEWVWRVRSPVVLFFLRFMKKCFF